MAKLYACPFCRQLFAEGEVSVCPDCDIEVLPLDELPPSHEAELIDPAPPDPPQFELLPYTYVGRMRGVLLAMAAGGIGLFCAPWLVESAPEIRVLSGFQFARTLAWLWAPPVAWFIMFALVLSRRTIHHMRGARLAVILLALMVLMTVLMRIFLPVDTAGLIPRRFEWGWGLYASGLWSVLAMVAATRFGGALDDMPTQQRRRGDETLH